jgi:FMN-dependent NADH-azoreductase
MSINVLLVQSSARGAGSTSRKLAVAAVDHIKASGKTVTVVERGAA